MIIDYSSFHHYSRCVVKLLYTGSYECIITIVSLAIIDDEVDAQASVSQMGIGGGGGGSFQVRIIQFNNM